MTLLTSRAVMARLGLTERSFYRHKAALIAAGLLVEALPRIGRRQRWLAQPIADYEAGHFRRHVLRQLGRTA